MNKKLINRTAVIFIISIFLNWFSIMISPYASPDDLGQLAFILVIFFPAAALLTGIFTRRSGLSLTAAALISALSVAIVILVRYNSTGLIYAPIYAAVAIAGYLAAWGMERLIKSVKK